MNKQLAEELFNDSYERISDWSGSPEKRNHFFRTFYDYFIASSTEVAEAFKNTDLDLQAQMLRKSIVFLVNFYANPVENDFLRKIALRHSRHDLNIRPELYELWMNSLITAVSECDAKYNEETAQAWREVLSPGIEYMISKY